MTRASSDVGTLGGVMPRQEYTTPNLLPNQIQQRRGQSGVAGTMLSLIAGCTLGISTAARAQTIPPSAILAVRTLDSVSASADNRGRVVRAMVVAPFYQDGRVLVAPRTILEGEVEEAGPGKAGRDQHHLLLHFTSLHTGDGTRIPISARVASIDNARETIESDGRILGPPTASLGRSRRTWAALALGTVDPVAGVVLFAVLQGEVAERHRRVAFAPGTDMTVRLTSATTLPAWPDFAMPPEVEAAAGLPALIASLPLRSLADRGRLHGDFANVMFLAGDDDLRRAFEAAGWTSPDKTSTRSDFETFIQAAKGAGYSHQPVSAQTMFGRSPDLVYQRVADTFAKRHHVRLWRTDAAWQGVPVWVAAATHDVGVLFSRRYRSFTHRIDPAIDDERDKIVNDLITSGSVLRLSMVPRAAPPSRAVSGPITSDWRVAVMQLRRLPEPLKDSQTDRGGGR